MNLDLRLIVENSWGRGRRSGKATVYRSRWREDRNPSFAVYENGYNDFATGDHGDAIDFVRREFNLDDRAAAAIWLAAHGYNIPEGQRGSPAPEHEREEIDAPPSAQWQDVARRVIEQAQRFLWSGQPDALRALDYLRGRGLTDDTIRAAALGFNPHKLRLEVTPGEMVNIAAGVVMPIIVDEVVWALKLNTFGAPKLAAAFNRRPADKIGKYIHATGSKTGAPYMPAGTLESPKQADRQSVTFADLPVLIVEGEYDAMIAQQQLDGLALVITVGSATNHLARRWRDVLRGRSVWILPDGDKAGGEGAARFSAQLPGARIIALPSGTKDANDYHLSGGDLRAWFIAATAGTGEIRQSTDRAITGLTSQIGKSARVHADGVPNTWTSALMNLRGGGANAALVYFLLNEAARADEIDATEFTIGDLLRASMSRGWGLMGDQIIRRGLQLLVKIEFLSKPDTKEDRDSLVCDFERNTTVRGRKRFAYALRSISDQRAALISASLPGVNEDAHPTIEDVPETRARLADMTPRALTDAGLMPPDVQQVSAVYNRLVATVKTADDRRAWGKAQFDRKRLDRDLDDLTHTPLTDDPAFAVRDLDSFRAAFVRARLAQHDGERMTQGEIKRIAGVRSLPAVKRAMAAAGVGTVEASSQEARDSRLVRPSRDIVRQINQLRGELKGAPFAMQAVDLSTGEIIGESSPYDPGRAEQLATRGYALKVDFRTAYTISLSPDANPIRESKASPHISPKLASAAPREHEDEAHEIGHYRASWVRGQVITLLRRLRWQEDRDYVNPLTGFRTATTTRDLGALLTVLTGQLVTSTTPERPTNDESDPLLRFARGQLGAVITRLESAS